MRKAVTPGEDEGLLELVHSVMHRFRSQQYQALRSGPHDITHMEGKVLGYLALHPGATQSDLARDSQRDKAQLARVIKGLRDQQLLNAEADAADRRNLRLHLTAGGQAVLGVLLQQQQRLATQAVAGLSDSEKQQLLALLQRVKRNFDAPV